MAEQFVIVGAGQAAAQAVQTLRQSGFAGAITLVGDEPYLPYQRPPLSKKFLAGELTRERLLLRPPAFYTEKGVELIVDCRAAELDASARAVRLTNGRTLRYDRLLLATGSRARKLGIPGADLPGLLYLRTIADVDAINAALTPGARVVLIGAGYIGLEVAAVLVQRGFAVTVLEAAERVMARVVSAPVAEYYAQRHTAAGVALHLRAAVSGLGGRDRVTHVEAADGRRFPCDVAIVGIGVEPVVELAAKAGLPCADGIVVDEHAQTEDPNVFGAGDCTSHWLPLYGRRVRLESVANAIHQAKVAAAAMLGTPAEYSEAPWFWSDQYDLKLQIAGLAAGYDELVVRGDPQTGSFAVYYLAGGTVIAADAINSPRDFLHARKLVAARRAVPAAALGDPTTDLAALG